MRFWLCFVFASANNAAIDVLVHKSPQGYYSIRIDSHIRDFWDKSYIYIFFFLI